MSNITTKLNLSGLKSVITTRTNQNGDKIEGLFIPIDANNLFRGEKGVYLDLTHMPLKEVGKDGRKDTHLVKQNLPKEVYDTLSEEEKKELPIIGNTIVWNSSNHVGNAPAPVEIKEEDDLPF